LSSRIECDTIPDPGNEPGVLAMSKKHLPIAIDTLGGDHSLDHMVQGAIESGVPSILVGPERILRSLLDKEKNGGDIEIVNAELAVEPTDHPVSAYRTKKDSSMMTAIRLVKDGKAGGVISPGNTGAFMMGATMILKRLTNVTRPAAAIPIPARNGPILLLDAGASTDCTSADLVNFAVMGSSYVSAIWKIQNPRIGLLSVGEEEIKGSKQARDAHQRLKQGNLNFIGNVQGNDIASGIVDVIVTDGFTGNAVLKAVEGTAALIMEIAKDELKAAGGFEKLASMVMLPMIKRIKKRMDWQEYGGGSLLGVNGNVVIAHGKSTRRAIASAVRLAGELAQTDLLHQLENALQVHHNGETLDNGTDK